MAERTARAVATFQPDSRLVLQRAPLVERHAEAHTLPLERVGDRLRGALYDARGGLIRLSQRCSGVSGDILTNDDPERREPPAGARRIEGRGLYIGNIFAHYGHFITEGLGATWYALQEQGFDYYTAHHFIFGHQIEAYAAWCYRALGIDPARILIVREPTVYAALTVPERGWHLNLQVLSVCGAVFRRLREGPAEEGIKLYLSRAGIGNRRTVANEEEMERLFQARGFRAVRPEALSFPEQLALYRRARVIAGFNGSALHNVLFTAPGTPVIAIGDGRRHDAPAQNQRLCNSLAGGPIHTIPFAARDGRFDLDHLRRSLEALGA